MAFVVLIIIMVAPLDTQIPRRPQIKQTGLEKKMKFLFKALC